MKTSAFLAMVVVLLVGHSTALASGVAIGIRPLNTIGVTGELTTATLFHDNLNARAGFNFFSYKDHGTVVINDEKIGYDAGIQLNSILLSIDWHPGGNNFRVVPGLYYNLNDLSADVYPTETVTSGSLELEPDELGMVTAKLDYPDFAPYLGIGWGNAIQDGKRIRFAFDLGLLYLQSPTVKLNATELLSPTVEQADDITRKMRDYKFWLVLSVGVSFRLL